MSNCGEKQINEIVREEVLPLVTFLGMREREGEYKNIVIAVRTLFGPFPLQFEIH